MMNQYIKGALAALIAAAVGFTVVGVITSSSTSNISVDAALERTALIPGVGVRIKERCVHQVTPGSTVRAEDLKPSPSECFIPLPSSQSWVETAILSPNTSQGPGNYYPNDGGYTWGAQIQVQFVVPPVPTDPTANVALFSALQAAVSASQTGILQPCLLWGNWTCSGPAPVAGYWQMTNEMVLGTDAGGYIVACNNIGKVAPGTILTAQIYADPSKPCENDGFNCSWVISEGPADAAVGQGYFEVQPGPLWQWSMINPMAVEQFNISTCAQLPGGDGTQLRVNTNGVYQAGYPWPGSIPINFDTTNRSPASQWAARVYPWDGPDCGFSVVTYPDSGAVTFTW